MRNKRMPFGKPPGCKGGDGLASSGTALTIQVFSHELQDEGWAPMQFGYCCSLKWVASGDILA